MAARKTEFIVDPNKPTVVMRRVFDAPRRLVFEAMTKHLLTTRADPASRTTWPIFFRARLGLSRCPRILGPGRALSFRSDRQPPRCAER